MKFDVFLYLQDFSGSEDDDLEQNLLSAVCQVEEEYKARAQQPAQVRVDSPPPGFVLGFQTARGERLTYSSKEAEERAKRLWDLCDAADEPNAATSSAAVVDLNASKLPALLVKGDVRENGSSRSAVSSEKIEERVTEDHPMSEKAAASSSCSTGVSFQTAAGEPLVFSQAAFDKYAKIYETVEDDGEKDDACEESRPPTPVELPFEILSQPSSSQEPGARLSQPSTSGLVLPSLFVILKGMDYGHEHFKQIFNEF